MPSPFSRRSILTGGSLALGTFLLDPPCTRAQGESPPAGLYQYFPAQDRDEVREVVGVSHFSLEKVQALVESRPELAKASWDWGFGDWESALGAASHTGNYEIASYLMEHGARPNIFTAAMMGHLDAVKSYVTAFPGIQGFRGPHDITLRRHAESGGERAQEVLAYLDSLGDADLGPTNLPLEIPQEAYTGKFGVSGTDGADWFTTAIGSREQLGFARQDGTPRTLLHAGNHVFHPAGAPSVTVRFVVEGGVVTGLEVLNPDLIASATRM